MFRLIWFTKWAHSHSYLFSPVSKGMLLFCSGCGACGAWAGGENDQQGDNRLAHAEQASTHLCIVWSAMWPQSVSAVHLQPSNPLQFANAKLFGRGWTIAMRCEQLQCDSTTIGSQFSVQCIPSKSHYAVAWGASMQWQCIIIQEKI